MFKYSINTIYQKTSEGLPEEAMLWPFHNQNSQWEGVLFIWYTHTVNDICVVPQVVIQTCFTVKSADSGIQNSADGSREMLANTASNNSLADAGKTQRHTSVIT